MTDFPLLGDAPRMRIGDAWVAADETREVLNPADESVVARVPEGGERHVEQALEAARGAQRAWARRSGVERGALLRAVVAAIREHADELARLVVAEQGKTIVEARVEVEQG